MSYYITRQAPKWAKSEKCSDAQLINALQEMERGLTGNALGANLYKKRIAVPGAGKSGGWLIGECLDFCVQGGFQGGSQSRLSFVYKGVKNH